MWLAAILLLHPPVVHRTISPVEEPCELVMTGGSPWIGPKEVWFEAFVLDDGAVVSVGSAKSPWTDHELPSVVDWGDLVGITQVGGSAAKDIPKQSSDHRVVLLSRWGFNSWCHNEPVAGRLPAHSRVVVKGVLLPPDQWVAGVPVVRATAQGWEPWQSWKDSEARPKRYRLTLEFFQQLVSQDQFTRDCEKQAQRLRDWFASHPDADAVEPMKGVRRFLSAKDPCAFVGNSRGSARGN